MNLVADRGHFSMADIWTGAESGNSGRLQPDEHTHDLQKERAGEITCPLKQYYFKNFLTIVIEPELMWMRPEADSIDLRHLEFQPDRDNICSENPALEQVVMIFGQSFAGTLQ